MKRPLALLAAAALASGAAFFLYVVFVLGLAELAFRHDVSRGIVVRSPDEYKIFVFAAFAVVLGAMAVVAGRAARRFNDSQTHGRR